MLAARSWSDMMDMANRNVCGLALPGLLGDEERIGPGVES